MRVRWRVPHALRYRSFVSHPPLDRWREATPDDAARWLARATAPWWIAGGHVVDLHLGRRTRAHGDLDVGCFRADLDRVREALPGWELYAARDGALTLLRAGAPLATGVNSVWCHPADADVWWLELLLEDRDGPDWVFRRCARVRRPAAALALVDPRGRPYLRPEIQLLYKAKVVRARDEADLAALLPTLDLAARAWLADALANWAPGHHWLSRLRA